MKDRWQQRKDSARVKKKRKEKDNQFSWNQYVEGLLLRVGARDASDSLFSCGWQEPHHLHGQLQTLKVVLQILSFHGEAVLLVSRSNVSLAIKHFPTMWGVPKGAVTRHTSVHYTTQACTDAASHANTQAVSIQMFLQLLSTSVNLSVRFMVNKMILRGKEMMATVLERLEHASISFIQFLSISHFKLTLNPIPRLCLGV